MYIKQFIYYLQCTFGNCSSDLSDNKIFNDALRNESHKNIFRFNILYNNETDVNSLLIVLVICKDLFEIDL